jgi:predicted ATP-dependent endonuclease of OLD family
MKKVALSLTVLAAVFSACSTTKVVTQEKKFINITDAGVIQTPMMVDLDISPKKVSSTVTQSVNDDQQAGKSLAVVRALAAADSSDVLVEPQFTIETKSNKRTITVSGYPAKYTNFRKMESKDVQLVESALSKRVEVYKTEGTSSNTKKRKLFLGLGWLSSL